MLLCNSNLLVYVGSLGQNKFLHQNQPMAPVTYIRPLTQMYESTSTTGYWRGLTHDCWEAISFQNRESVSKGRL
jgi:hypothetical protein